MPTHRPDPRILQWEACWNVRDLGGLPLRDGGTTRRGALVRADTLCRLTPDGCRSLVAHGVRTIVDLRFPEEAARAPYPCLGRIAGSGVAYYNAPINAGRDPALDAARSAAFGAASSPVDSYRLELDANPRGLALIAAAIAQAADGGVVVHCHAGKDRTGIVVMLVLALAGVPDEVIVDDYALSMPALQPEFERWLAEEAPEEPAERERLIRMQRAEAATMRHTLTYLTERFGGAEQYLLAGGLPRGDAEVLQRRLRG